MTGWLCLSGPNYSKTAGPIKKCYCKELSQIAQGSKWAKKIAKKLPKTPNWQKVAKMAKNAKVAKSPQIRLQVVSRGSRWFQVSNSMGSDDSGDLRAGTLRVRGARLPAEGRQASRLINKIKVFGPLCGGMFVSS